MKTTIEMPIPRELHNKLEMLDTPLSDVDVKIKSLFRAISKSGMPDRNHSVFMEISIKEDACISNDERARLDAAYDLCCEGCKATGNGTYMSYEYFVENHKDFYLAIVDKTNYRKQ